MCIRDSEQSARIYIKHVTKIYIQDVTFMIGFGRNKVELVDNFTLEHSSFFGNHPQLPSVQCGWIR